MKLLLSLSLLVLTMTGLLAQKAQSSADQTQSVVLSEESDSPIILFDKKEITQNELAAMDKSEIGDIEILSGEEAKERFGKYEKNGAIVISSTPPADVISKNSFKPASPSAPGEQIVRASGEEIKLSLDSALDAHVVIDGKASTMEILQAMKPAQIESMEVLKGDVAALKYGEVAKDGAIEVTTKQ